MAENDTGSRAYEQRQNDDHIERETLCGTPQHIIADTLGITQQQVSLDLAKLGHRWKKEVAEADKGMIVGRELKTLDLLMREAMQGWQDSRSKGGPGDARFLHIGARVVELRTKLLGFIQSAQLELGEPSPNELSEHFYAALSEESSVEDDGVDFLN